MDEYGLSFEEELALQAYLDGELPPVEREVLEERLRQEPKLAAALAEWRALISAIDTAGIPPLQRDIAAAVVANLARDETDARTLRRLTLAELALIALLVIGSWPLWQLSLPALFRIEPGAGLAAAAGAAHLQAALWQERLAAWVEAIRAWTAQLGESWGGLLAAVPLSTSWLLSMALVAFLVWLVGTGYLVTGRPQNYRS